jgi:Arylsulfotransferase (ASST)
MADHGGQDAGAGLTRADLVRRGFAGGVGLALLGGLPARGLRLRDAAAAPTKKSPVHGFVTRPDLRPPKIYVVADRGGTADGYLFLAPPGGPGMRGGLIADNNGDPVYFHPTKPRTTMDFRPGMLRGRPVLTWWEGRYVFGVGKVGDYVIMDDTYREIARFSSARHRRPDFHEVLLTDHNTLLVTAYETVSADLTPIGGPADGLLYGGLIQELAVPSGRLLWEWRSLDHVDLTETVTADQLGSPYDYFHINGIEVADDGHLIVSARNTSAIYKIDRRTGKVIWRLGGKKSDFSMGKGTQFGFQHDARVHEGGRTLSLFDNGPRPGEGKPESRAIVLSLDTRRMQATLKHEIRHRSPIFAFATGSNQLLPNANRLVTWGITGWFTEYDADGAVCLDARLSDKGQNYRVYRFPWEAKPTVRPAFKAYRNDGAARFYASWNGATALAAWQLLTGPRSGALSESGKHPKQGFETSFAIPHGTRYAAVVALDARGTALERSRTIRLF